MTTDRVPDGPDPDRHPEGRHPEDRRPDHRFHDDRRPGDPRRIAVDPESVRRSLAGLVLTIVELLRQLMERQALRRVDQGGISDEQIEELGLTLMALEEQMTELREHFGLTQEDLNLDLGPLGPLLPRD
ncbi:gas vesicle protein K [Streptomyces sparsogenes DSM 40356]|uniref:Gas vesicle protein K n=1 Tax=Streptomyces sparsogenes DSM 40356 TaxID=1331668 RepID=A0A1R1S9B1_9ACTN|nr:gas vesicle protein K [Streptomyces sparsogenes DSM 40356]